MTSMIVCLNGDTVIRRFATSNSRHTDNKLILNEFLPMAFVNYFLIRSIR